MKEHMLTRPEAGLPTEGKRKGSKGKKGDRLAVNGEQEKGHWIKTHQACKGGADGSGEKVGKRGTQKHDYAVGKSSKKKKVKRRSREMKKQLSSFGNQ